MSLVCYQQHLKVSIGERSCRREENMEYVVEGANSPQRDLMRLQDVSKIEWPISTGTITTTTWKIFEGTYLEV